MKKNFFMKTGLVFVLFLALFIQPINTLAVDPITVKEIKTSTEYSSVPVNTIEYSGSDDLVIPVTVNKPGGVVLEARTFTLQGDGTYVKYLPKDSYSYFTVYQNSELTTRIGSVYYMNASEVVPKILEVANPGTIYLVFDKPYNDSTNFYIQLMAYEYVATGGTLTKSNPYISYLLQNEPNYLKLTAGSTGTLTVSTANLDMSTYLTLCDSKKKAISSEIYVSSSNPQKINFGVKKGTTYYIKVKASYGALNTTSFTTKAISDTSGSTKAKAKSLKLGGSTVNGLLIAGNNTADWYKFTLTKSKKILITINNSFCDSYSDKANVVIYKTNGGKDEFSIYSNSQRLIESFGKLPKGTYYIKINKPSGSKASGKYTIKVK